MTVWPHRPLTAGNFDSTTVTFTANASANTKGNYSQVWASTSVNACGLVLNMEYVSNDADYLLDLAFGAAGSEQIVVADIIISGATYTRRSLSAVHFPIFIKAGTRIACRVQSSTGGATVDVHFSLINFDTRIPTYSKVLTYGAASADSGGLSLDSGGSAWTWGGYSELSASSPENHKALIIGMGNQTNNARANAFFNIGIGIGAAGSEVAIAVVNEQGAAIVTAVSGLTAVIPVKIKSGTRIAARSQSGTTDATDRLIDVVLYGLS